jgi:anti-sigma factor (TIGR02949 family)
MKCEVARPRLEAYLDGELDRASSDELETHLATCAACRAELASLEQLRDSLRSLPGHRAPAELRARLTAATELPALPSRIAPKGATWRMAAALLLGIAIGVSAMVWSGLGREGVDRDGLLARDLLTSHLRALAANTAIDIVSEDRHTVKPWFAGKIGESPPVIDPRAEDFPLLGGRIDYVGGRRTAVIVYGHRKHVIDVFMTPQVADARGSETQGYTITPCRLEGQSAWIVSDIDGDSLRRFTGLLGCDT